MAYSELHLHTSKEPITESILQFFGFHLTCEKDTRLKALKSDRLVYEDGKFKEEVVGLTTEETGFYRSTLSRYNTPSKKNLELEEQFIQSVGIEGRKPKSSEFIWNTPCPCMSIDSYYNAVSASPWPGVLTFIVGLLAAIWFGYSFYQYYLVRSAGLPEGVQFQNACLALFGGIAITLLVYWLTSLLFEGKPLNQLSQKQQEAIREEYLSSLGCNFSPQTQAILRQYAILNHYDRISTLKRRSKWIPFVCTVVALAAAVFLWFEVITVQVYLVTESATESQKTVWEYDHLGQVRQMYIYDSQGQLLEGIDYVYNDDDELESSVHYKMKDGERSFISGSEYVLNAFDRISSQTFTNAKGKETSKVYFSRNFSNMVTEESEYIGKERQRRSSFEYKNNLVVRQVDYVGKKGDEQEVAVWEYSYKSKGRLTGSKLYREGILVSETICAYDGDKLMTRTDHSYDKEGNITATQKTEYAYGKNGHLEKITQYADDVPVSYSAVTCDENGNIIQTVSYYEDGQPTGSTTGYQYRQYRMTAAKAKALLMEWGESQVIIDYGWF